MKHHEESSSLSIEYLMADHSDLAEVQQLLAHNKLPSADLEAHFDHVAIAKSDGAIIGSAGLEFYGREALLRSVCVAERYRNRGLANHLCDLIEAHARNIGVTHFYLLTTTAQLFFTRRGFEVCARDALPSSIRQSEEFRKLCPASAVCMSYVLRNGALYLPSSVLTLREDVPGARMWAAGLANTMLTYFEVDPHTRFEMHLHEGEQITSVIEGELFFAIDDRIVRVGSGEAMAIPAGVSHAVYTRENGAKAFDAWSPPPARYHSRIS